MIFNLKWLKSFLMGPKKQFSLIELLVVFAVLAVIFSLLSARLNKLTQLSHSNLCQQQLSNLFVGLELYVSDNDNYLPGPLLTGQGPRVTNNAIAGHLHPYLTTKRRSDNRADVLIDLICPSNESSDSVLPSDRRLHYRTHISPSSTTYFGYPRRRDSLSYDTIPDPGDFNFLRDHSKLEYDQLNRRPGWYDLLSDLPPHFKTDVNILSMDGRVTPTRL